jgi:hypothetical protein
LEYAESQNKRKKALEATIAELSEKQQMLLKYISVYDRIVKQLQIKAASYRAQRKTELEEMTTTVLRRAFPNEEYQIKIDWNSTGTKPTAQILNSVTAKDGSVEYYPPSHINGELAKQVIAFTTLCSMCGMLNADFIGYDECLNSGDDNSLVDIKPLFDKLMEAFQIIMIEHKDSLYQNLNRREIHIDKIGGDDEPMSGETKIIRVSEVDGNEGVS